MDKFYQKIKEGGYNFERLGNPKSVVERDNALLLDSQAWQCLGKAEGRDKVCDDCGEGYMKSRDNCTCGMTYPPLSYWWEYAWHRFIDHLAEGKDAESFFNELLKLMS